MPIPLIYSSSALTVAGDPAYDAQLDPYDGSAVKVEPSIGALAQGLLRPGRQIPAQHVNWLNGQFAAIMAQLIADTATQDFRLAADDAELANHETRIVANEAWITNKSPRIRVYQFLTSTTWVVPPRVISAIGYGCGGGGGGGTGHDVVLNGNADDLWIAGAAGGGGAYAQMFPLGSNFSMPAGGSLNPLVPGTTLNIDIGAGGTPYGAAGGTGNDGGDSKIRLGAALFATFTGAAGGRGSVGLLHAQTVAHFTMGGLPVRDTPVMLIGNAGQGIRFGTAPGEFFGTSAGSNSLYIPMQAGQGGFGNSGNGSYIPSNGSRNLVGGATGGTGGHKGQDLGSIRGGGGAGGGGAGPWGNGGNGGNGHNVLGVGGAPNNYDGLAPTAGAANSGAGGGGSGSTGSGNTYPPPLRNGAAGGSGRVYIITVEDSP